MCPKCGGTEIVHLEAVHDRVDGSSYSFVSRSLTVVEKVVGSFLGISSVVGGAAFGPLEAYTCRACGFVEEYVKEPRTVPWEKVPGARILRR